MSVRLKVSLYTRFFGLTLRASVPSRSVHPQLLSPVDQHVSSIDQLSNVCVHCDAFLFNLSALLCGTVWHAGYGKHLACGTSRNEEIKEQITIRMSVLGSNSLSRARFFDGFEP